jgi:hypothetical protein
MPTLGFARDATGGYTNGWPTHRSRPCRLLEAQDHKRNRRSCANLARHLRRGRSEVRQHSFSHSTTGGLYDRFFFGLSPTGFRYQFRPWAGTPTHINPRAVTIHQDVFEAKNQWEKDNPELANRVSENALRAAIICAAWDGRCLLTASNLGPALALAEYGARARTVLLPNPGMNLDARCAFAITSTLKTCKGPVKRRDLYNAIHAERYGPGAFDRAVRSLEFNGELEQTGQRPKYIKMLREDE